MSPLYAMTGDEGVLWVQGANISVAVLKWQDHVAQEAEMKTSEVGEPVTIDKVCEDSELLL